MIPKAIINTEMAPATIGPYSQAIKYGNLIFLSGQIAINPVTNDFVNGDISSQTKQVIENIKAILESTGSSLDNVLKTTIYITDMKNFNNINLVYAEYFKKSLPARACVEVSKLPKGALVEIEAIAGIE